MLVTRSSAKQRDSAGFGIKITKSAGTSFAVLTDISYRYFCNMVEIDNQRTRRKTTLQNTSSLADVASTAVRCHLCSNIATKELLDFGVMDHQTRPIHQCCSVNLTGHMMVFVLIYC
jgi:hypothetical protein